MPSMLPMRWVPSWPHRAIGVGDGGQDAEPFVAIGAAPHPAAEQQPVALGEQPVGPPGLRRVDLAPGLEPSGAQSEHLGGRRLNT